MPVSSMSSRLRIGCVQTFGKPGNCSSASISACSFSNVIPGRHWSRGFSTTVVLTMPIGELSVGVVPRPTVPNTRSTSGTWPQHLVLHLQQPRRLGDRHPGGAVGMYSIEPS